MSLRDVLRRWFGASEEVDPDEPTEIGIIPITSGPIALAQLRAAGFRAVGHDSINILSDVASGFRILVPQQESEAAAAKLEEILHG